MPCPGARQSLRELLRDANSSSCPPSFLIPAFLSFQYRRCFSNTTTTRSRIGKTPVSIPSEVSLRLYDLPQNNTRSRRKDVPSSAIEVVGPLGEDGDICLPRTLLTRCAGQMTLNLPPYLIVDHNEKTKKANVSVKDPKQDHQRAMWGEQISSLGRRY